MVKELRELVTFVLAFGLDVLEAVRNSALPTSPSASVGVDRVKALNVSAVVAIVLISIFIKTLSAVRVDLDLLLFSVLCIFYFMISAMLVSFYLRRLAGKATEASTAKDDPSVHRADPDIDAHATVLGFNIVALLSFALLRELAVFRGYGEQIDTVNWIAAIVACLLAIGLFVIIGRFSRAANRGYALRLPQRATLLGLMSIMFFLYTRIIVA
jgi:hypothetical protein